MDMSRYLTDPTAWFLKNEPNPALETFYRSSFSDSLEALCVAVKRQADGLGRPIVLRPTRLIVHPSWTREQVEERLRQL